MSNEPTSEPNGATAVDEFADYAGEMVPFEAEFAWSRLLSAPTLRGLAALIGGLVFLFSSRSTEALALIVAIVVAVWAVAEFFAPAAKSRVLVWSVVLRTTQSLNSV